jgi:hypothetical protein
MWQQIFWFMLDVLILGLSDVSKQLWEFIVYNTPTYIFTLYEMDTVLGGGVQLGPLGTAATNRHIMPVPGDYDVGETVGFFGRVNRNTRRKPAPVHLCPQQTPHVARTRTRAAAWATALPAHSLPFQIIKQTSLQLCYIFLITCWIPSYVITVKVKVKISLLQAKEAHRVATG